MITGHGIDEGLIAALYDASKAFFAQPLASKAAYSPLRRSDNLGYLPKGIESVASTLAGETPPTTCRASARSRSAAT